MDPNNPNPTPNASPPSGEETVQPGKRSADERIDQLIAQIRGGEEEKARMRQELEDLKQRVPPPPAPVGINPEVQRAVDALKGLGFVQKNDLEAKVRAIEDRYELNSEHSKYEQEFDGNDGRPKYDRSSIEKFMKDRAIYDPLSAYKLMHEPELLDWTLKQQESKRNPGVHIETPGSAGIRQDDDTILTEKLKQHQQNPTEESRIWYENNRLKLLDMLARGEI